ncbi:MAG TPA: epoxide hydrolase, partial [Gemmatimonadaceae bacterium]|nr:epoxide hydrolase [Gemmatimonadaceae bacterium]
MPDLDRRRFFGAAAATLAASQLGLLVLPRRLQAMTQPIAEGPLQTTSVMSDIRPFRVSVPEEQLTDLRHRIKATKWPERETLADDTQGVQLATMQALASHWANEYDWRKAEARINSYPNFITNIDGIDIHFIHVKSKEKNALPMIVTHGWPGSFIEQMKIIDPLTNPTKYGGNAADAFDVVIPSIPGYGFSGKPTAPGWNPVRIAKTWITLMRNLGYNKYVAQGGDWGNAITEIMALQAPPELLGISTNMAATVPADIDAAIGAGKPKPAGLTADESRAWDQLGFFYKNGLGYANEMSLRPQTLYGIADSPIGLAAWILDHDDASQKMIARVFAGQREGLSRDDILDNITMYWLTNTAISSARLYWDTAHTLPPGGFFSIRNVKLPVVVTVFPDEIYAAPKTWAERAYTKMIYYNKFPKGGHFAA